MERTSSFLWHFLSPRSVPLQSYSSDEIQLQDVRVEWDLLLTHFWNLRSMILCLSGGFNQPNIRKPKGWCTYSVVKLFSKWFRFKPKMKSIFTIIINIYYINLHFVIGLMICLATWLFGKIFALLVILHLHISFPMSLRCLFKNCITNKYTSDHSCLFILKTVRRGYHWGSLKNSIFIYMKISLYVT